MKILILTPILSGLGGVSSHINGLKPHWTIDVGHHEYGKNRFNDSRFVAVFKYIWQYITFIFKVINYDVVLINPSFRRFQLIRDGAFLLTARLLGKRIIVMFHGFDVNLANEYIANNNRLFKWVYNQCEFMYTLYSGFKQQLIQLGITKPIILTTTKVTDSLLTNFDLTCRDGCIKTLLFVARIEETKGIYITIDAFALLKNKYPYLKLIVCGDGTELFNVKNYVKKLGIENVIFTGAISQEQVSDYYKTSDIFILPTYFEGMATSILEAMAFGLPIVSTPVGGIQDFFIQDKMGKLIESKSSRVYADVIEEYICNNYLVRQISEYNHYYAVEHFLASRVVLRIENDIKEYLVNN